MEKIRIRDLTFQYPLGEFPALNGIDLTVEESDFVVVCGRSGCGKSTLLRQMKNSLMPYGEKNGEVLYDGIPIEELDQRRDAAEIGFVLQNPESQIVTDKVWHELAFGLENLGLPRQIIKRRVAEMASYFGINSWFRKEVASLSGGQKQTLNLASVMAMQPKVLILDEPASQLDPIAATDFLGTVFRINRDFGTTVIISEHRLEEVFPMANKALVLEKGKTAAFGTPSEVGRILEKGDGTDPHPMYFGMPAVMRTFSERTAGGSRLPLTIREGRILIEKIVKDPEVSYDPEKEKEEIKAENRDVPDIPKEELAVSTRDIYFRYERTMEPVIRGLDLQVRKGELFCLLGGNGSGKTTTLKILAGLLKPQRGSLKIAEGMRSALVPQDPQALFTEITVEEEILEGMADTAVIRLSDREKITRVNELLALMEIEHLRKANPYDLSGGEQQRLALARVMACEPDLLLLDEPTKGLDPFFKRTLGGILKKLLDGGTTIFMVSHDIDFCAVCGDTCAMFFDGEITSFGTAEDFFKGNNYYTTSANKLVRRWRPDIITCEGAREWLEGQV